jgi:hypothetical protein
VCFLQGAAGEAMGTTCRPDEAASSLWLCFEGANDWKICRLVPKSDDEEKGTRESRIRVLNALEARMSHRVREGDIGVVGTEDEAAMGVLFGEMAQ